MASFVHCWVYGAFCFLRLLLWGKGVGWGVRLLVSWDVELFGYFCEFLGGHCLFWAEGSFLVGLLDYFD